MICIRILVGAALTAGLAGCASTPSYYSQRVGPQPATAYTASAAVAESDAMTDEAPAPRQRQRVRRQVARSAPPATSTARVAAPDVENTGATASSSTDEMEQARAASRDRAINRSINSICRGC
jgi:hypothetical protein